MSHPATVPTEPWHQPHLTLMSPGTSTWVSVPGMERSSTSQPPLSCRSSSAYPLRATEARAGGCQRSRTPLTVSLAVRARGGDRKTCTVMAGGSGGTVVTGKPWGESRGWHQVGTWAQGVFRGAALTPGHGGDDLAEGATAQLVLGQDAELVTGVWLQVLHQKVLSPRWHRQ